MLHQIFVRIFVSTDPACLEVRLGELVLNVVPIDFNCDVPAGKIQNHSVFSVETEINAAWQ